MKLTKRQLITHSIAIVTMASVNDAAKADGGNSMVQNLNNKKPIIIAHRGASGYRPEHTIASYQIAIEMGTDFIEPDLVFTKDGHLICRHENNISDTTNVADKPEFATRKTTKIIDGETINGWFSEDFTLAEIKTLRCKERLPQLRPQNTKYDGKFEIPTFEEVLELRQKASQEMGREIGVYPETKHPSYFASQNLDFDLPLLSLLSKYEMNSKEAPVFIQSFETINLKRLAQKTKVKLIQLMSVEGGPWDSQSGVTKTYQQMISSEGLKEIATYAYGIGPEKTMIIPRDKDNKSLPPTTLVSDCHNLGLKLHPWTFRAENYFLADEFRQGSSLSPFYLRHHGALEQEIKQFVAAGIDGLFCDFADIAVKALKN
jgi:glycerophosphoryl diester phosphodiesterase